MTIGPGPIPPVDLLAVHSSGRQSFVKRIVIHATCPTDGGFPGSSEPDTAWGTARYFQNPASGGSAHTVSDTDNLVRCLPENVVAWHAPPNDGSLGNEVGGQVWYTREQWLHPRVRMAWERTAHESARQALRWGVPIVKLSVNDLLDDRPGFAGHVDVSRAFRQSDHTDPGPNFPWDIFMLRVKFYAHDPSDPHIPGSDAPDDGELDMTPDELKKIIRDTVPGAVAAALRSEGVSGAADAAKEAAAAAKVAVLLATAINNTVNGEKKS